MVVRYSLATSPLLTTQDLVSTVSRHTPKSLRWQQAAAPAAAASSGASAKPFVAGEIVLGFARADGSLADVPEALLAMAAPSQGPEPADGAWKPLAPYKDLKPVSVTEIRVFSDEVRANLFVRSFNCGEAPPHRGGDAPARVWRCFAGEPLGLRGRSCHPEVVRAKQARRDPGLLPCVSPQRAHPPDSDQAVP